MEIIKGNRVKLVKLKDVYQVSVHTLEFDSMYEQIAKNSFKINFKNNPDGIEQLRECIISLECCSKQFPNGKGGIDNYNKLPYYEEYLDKWNFTNGFCDLFDFYRVRYFDNDGKMYRINITNDPEMIEIITECEIRI